MTATSEFSRPIAIPEALANGPVHRAIEATDAEREALARRFGLEALDELRATFDLLEVDGGAVVTGEVTAHVAQACVISLEPVRSHIRADVDVVFLPDPPEVESDTDEEATESDPPERLPDDGIVDLGELAAQYMALALDPYPRHPDATLPGGTAAAEAPAGPFAALAALKPKPRERR